jgi:very-short-patch-repair endonuclease
MTERQIVLGRADVCHRCRKPLSAGTTARWNPETKATACLNCREEQALRSVRSPAPTRHADGARPSTSRDGNLKWDELLRYQLACVQRAAAAQPVNLAATREWALLPVQREGLCTGETEDVPLGAQLGALFARAKSTGAVFYGWPVVAVRDAKQIPKVAPLVLTELQTPAAGAVHAVAADDHPRLNTALVSAGFFAPHAVAAASSVVSGGLAFGDATALTAQLKELLAALGLDGDGLDPRRLGVREGPLGPGVHNVAMAFQGVSDTMTRGLVAELSALRGREDWTSTAARYLLHPAPPVDLDDLPAPAAALTLNGSQEEALTASGAAQVTAVTGPPGTGKSQLVAAVVAGAWLRGETVLVASTNNQAVRAAVEKAHAVDDGTLVRTGNREQREALPGVLRWLAARPEPSGASPEIAQRRLDVAIAQRRSLLDQLASRTALEAELAQLAHDLEAQRSLLWNAPDRSPVHDRRSQLAARARRAGHARWFKEMRSRRVLEAAQIPRGRVAGVADVRAWAEAELRWDAAQRGLAELPVRDGDAERAELAAADAEWTTASGDVVRHVVGTRIAAGRTALQQLADLRNGARSARVAAVAKALSFTAGWACTTLSAGSNFPLKAGLFDLLVVDEASQCSVADVIPMAYRARRIVVVGDPNQLAPVVTVPNAELAAVARGVGVDDDAMHAEGLSYGRDSAFAAFAQRADRRPFLLAEHYRCHPEIAGYINDVFYGGALEVLTDPSADTEGTRGLHWHQVEGRTEAGPRSGALNRAEADAVVRWVLAHPDEPGTLGVVTPFTAQATVIRNGLERALGPDVCAERELIVGTAHAFQGGERDLVLFSPVLSTDAAVNTARWVEAQRNLVNVAVSRAKRALIVVGDSSALARLPVPTLHALAAAAARVRSSTNGDLREDARLHSESERRLFAALQAAGAEVRLKPVVSGYELDFAVRLANGRQLDVECDGGQHLDPRGRQRRRDLARDEVLQHLGWQVIRVPAWRCLTEPERVAAEILTR